MKILVGLSGGVDSSVTALLLKQQGHEVIGATMSIWRGKCNPSGYETTSSSHKEGKCNPSEYETTSSLHIGGKCIPSGCETTSSLHIGDKYNPSGYETTSSLHKAGACYGPDEKEDIEEARKIAKQIGIPYYVFDCAEQYEKIVLDNFKSEYLKGKTPNPCIWCNPLIKFGALPQLAKAQGIEFDKFATGHYARIEDGLLKRGIAFNKDQSYFLYRLKPEQLENILLPLGNYTKEEIRRIAKENGLNTAEKPDSQDFYNGDYNELLGIKEKEGNIVTLSGKILGKHKGIWNYTIGQRKGLGISAQEALYVLELNAETNEVVVGFKDKTMNDKLYATNLNWIRNNPKDDFYCTAKIRSTQQPTDVYVKKIEKGMIEVNFKNMQTSIASGQSVVLYDNDIVLGGGIIL